MPVIFSGELISNIAFEWNASFKLCALITSGAGVGVYANSQTGVSEVTVTPTEAPAVAGDIVIEPNPTVTPVPSLREVDKVPDLQHDNNNQRSFYCN